MLTTENWNTHLLVTEGGFL